MRKPFLPFLIIGIITVAGVFFALTYKFPEIEAFQFYQKMDQELVNCEKKIPETLETTLNTLQVSINEIILVGKTYDGSQEVEELFSSFNSEFEVLKAYTTEVIPAMNEYIEKINFDKIDSTLSKLPENLASLATQMSSLQKTRIEKLVNLNSTVEELVVQLETFEEMFYNTKTSETVQYFQTISTSLEMIEDIHADYTRALKEYYDVKVEYYEAIANKNVFDYLFKK